MEDAIKRFRQFLVKAIKFVVREITCRLTAILTVLRPSYNYYRYIYIKKILSSAPIVCKKDSGLEIHILICEKDVYNFLWAIKTFRHYSGIDFNLILHEDGTLSHNSQNLILEHIRDCRIIKRADADKQLKTFLKNYPLSFKYRFDRLNPFNHLALKMFDFFFYSNSEYFLNLDPDVLCFKKPDDILGYIKDKRAFFSSDHKYAYSLPVDDLKRLFKLDMQTNLNIGVFYFDKKAWDIEMIESFLAEAFRNNKRFRHFWIDQTSYALLVARHNKPFGRLNENYQISKQKITDQTISHHFVSPVRKNFYLKGLRRLKKINFLEEFNRTQQHT